MATPAGTIDISARFDSSGLERDVLAALRRIETKSTISLNTRNFTQPLGKITGLANEFNKSLEASNARVVAFGASAGIIFNIQKAFSSLIKSTIEVEKSLTDINVVLGLSTKGIASFGDQLFDVAKNTGSAFQEVTSAAVEFSRQGLGLEQTLKRTRDALILTRLSGLDVVSSTEALTSAVNSFTKEALTTTDVVNKLAAVDARFAVSSADLSEAIKRVGSSASEAGVSFDELLGIVTSVQQTTARGGAVIGNALKTIFTRIERPEVINDLREFGIAVTDASGNILPTIKVIENLAQSFQSLNPVVKSQVAELVGGVYQINILKAALADVSKENSVFASATSTASKAVDEAILKNEALNKSLSALLNSTTANLTQLASKIGGVSVAPAVRKVLGTINDELTDINDKPAESVGAKIASGLLTGLTNFITGPGIGIGTLVVGKLLGNFTKFATDATKNFLGLNTVGQQQKVIQDETANILARNPQLIQGIISGSKSRLQVEKEIKQILMEQAALSEQIALSSRGMAERMVATGLSVTSTGGLRRSAGGFIPAKDRAAEMVGAAAGGYVAGNVIKAPDSIGGIMNSAESVKYVPGFAQPFILPPKGSKAASNLRNKSLRQVGIDPYLAKGFIPNFASEDQTLRQKNPQTMGPTLEGWLNLLKAKKSNPPKYFIENYEPNMTAAQFFEKVASEKLAQNSLATHLESFGLPKDEVKRIVNQSITTAGQTAEFGGKGRATLFAQTQKELEALKTYVPDAEMLVWRSEAAGPYYTNPSIAQAPRGNVVPVSFKVVPLDQTKISAEKVDIQEKSRNLSFNLLEEFAKSLPLSSEGQAAIAGSKISEYGERTPLAYRQLAGTIFEAGINLVSDYVRDAKNADQGDFDIRGGANIGNLRNFFPSFTSNLGDYKLSDTEDNKNSFLKKIWQEFKKPIGEQYVAETKRIAIQSQPEYVNLEVDRRIQEAGSIMAALEKTQGKRAASAANVPNKFSAGFIPNFATQNQQTFSPEFKQWFAGSKVVSEQGEPLRVYHGTSRNFSQFKPSTAGALGSGIYTTPDPEFANNYAKEQGANIMPLYASIKNPLILGAGATTSWDPMIEALQKLGMDKDKAEQFVEKAHEQKGYIGKQVQSRATSQGYDGIMQYRNGKLAEILAFNPTQIKSAIANRGTFDPSKKDIRYANGFIPNFAQRISSAGTSLNQIPALFKKFGKELGPRNIDIGGGKYDKGTNFLIEKFGISSRVHDKFNRSQEFNDQTIKDFFGISDTATIANVLNVIEEASEREELLEFTRQSIKPGGSAYFGIYEGNRSGIGADTSKGHQRNLRTDQYLEEISKYFDIRKRIGNYIIGSPLSSGFIPNFATGFNLSTIRFLMKAGGKLSGSVLSPKTLINFASGKGKLEDVIDPFISFLKKPADVIRSEQDLNDAKSLIKIIFANPTAREKIARKLAPIISETSFAVDSQVRAIEGLNPDKNDDNQSYEKFLRYRLLGGQAEFEDFNEDGTKQVLKKNKDGSYRFNPNSFAGRSELFGIFQTTRALFAEDSRDTFKKSENDRKGARKLGPEENVAGPNPFLGYTYKLGRFIGNLGRRRKAIKYEDRWDVELHDREREILTEYLKKAGTETSQFSFSKAEAFDRIQQEFKEGSYGGNIDSLILRELLSSIPNSKPVVLKGIHRIPKDLRFFKGFIPNFANNLDYNPNFLVGSGSDAIFLSAYDQLSGEFGGGPAYPEVVQGRSFATTSTGSLNTLNQNAMSIIRGGGKAFFSPVVNSNALESLGGNKFFLMALAKRYPRFSNFRLAREILKSPAGTFKISEIRGATNQIISNIQKNYGRNKGILRAREVAESISDKRFLNPQYKNLSTSLITEIVSNQGSIVAPNSGHSLYNLAALGGTSKMSNPVQYQKIFEGLIDKDRLSGLRNSYIPIGRRFNLGDDFSKTLGLASGFIPNFNPVEKAVGREMAAGYSRSQVRIGQDRRLQTDDNPFALGIYNTDEGSLAKGIRLAQQAGIDPKTKGKSEGHIPNFADFGTTDTVILFSSLTLLASQVKNLVVDFRQLSDATKKAVQNQKDITAASTANISKINKQFKTTEASIQKQASIFANINKNLKTASKAPLEVFDPASPSGRRLATADEIKQLEELRAQRSQAKSQKTQGIARERQSIQEAQQSAQNALKNRFGRYATTLGPTAGIVGSQLANVVGSFLPESDIKGKAVASGIGDIASFAGTGAAFGVPGLIVGTAAGIAAAFIKIKDAKADQAIFDIGKSLDQIKTKSAEFSSSAQGYAVSLEELQRALNDPQSRPEALSRFQKNLSDSLAAIPAEFRDKVFRAGTDLNKVTQAITDINKELSNTQRNLERELSIATLFKEKTTFLNKIGLSNFGLNEKDQKILERLFASSLNQQEVLKNFSNAAPGQDFETFINDLASQAVSVRNLATAPIGGTVGFTPLNQAQTTTQQFLDPARLEQIKSELSRRGVLTEGVAGQLDTAFEKGNIELVRSIFKTIAEEGKSLIEAEKRTRLLVEIQKENINRIKDNEQALKNLNKQYNNLNLLLSNQIDLEKNRASTIREINLIQSEGKVSIQRARTKGLLDASAPFITEQQRLDIQGQLDINEITTRGNARIQQAANELLDSFTNILVTQSQDARQEIVGLVSDPTTRPQDITRQRNVFQQTIQKLNPLITQSLRDINSGKNIKDIQTDLIGQIRNFAEFSPEQQDVLIQSIESSGSKLENQLGLILAETNRDLAIQQAQLEAQKQTLDLTRKLSFAGGAQALATTGEAGISQLYDNLSQLVSEFRKTNAIGTVAQRGSTSFKLLDVLTNQLQLNRATQAPTPFESADAFNNQVSSDLTNLTAVSIAGRVQQIRKSLNLAQRLTEIQTGQPTAGTALGRAFETAGQEAITTAMDQITAEFKLGNMGTYLDALQNEARYLNTLTQQQNDLLAKTLPDNLNQNFQKVITSQVGSKLDDLTTALRTTINSLATQTQKGVLETEQSNLLPIAAPDVRKQILERVLNQTGLKETPPAVSITSKTDPEKIKKFNEEMADLNEYINSLAILKVNPNTINSEDFRSVNLVKLNATIEEQKKAIDTQVRVRNKYPNYFTGANDAVNERLIEIRSLQKPAEEQVNKVTDLTGTYEGFVRSLNEEFGGRLLKGQEITVEQIKSLQANQKAMQELLQNPLQIMNVPTATNAYGPVEGAYAYGPNVVPAAQNQAGELNREIPDYLKTSRAATDRINQVLVARASITKDMSAVQEKVNKLLQQQTLDAEQQAELLKLQVELRKDVIEQDAKAADYLYNLYYSKDNRAFSDTFFREEKAAFADAEIRSQARSGNLALGAITQKNLEYTRIDFVKDTAEMIDEFQVNFKSGIGSAFGEAIKGTKSLQDAFRDMFQNLLNRMLDKSLQMGVDSLFAFGKAAAGFKNGGEIKKYNSGGMVTGGSGNKDDVLTMMRGGEFVIKKSSVNKYGSSYLEALNQQTIPTAADGGFAVGPLQNEFLYLNTPERPTSGEYAVDSRLSAMALTDENNPQNRLREQRFEELDRYLQDRAQFERDKDQAMKMYEKQVRSTFYSGLIAAGTQLASAGLNVGAQNLRLPKTGTTGIGKQYQAYSPDMPNYVGGKANGGFIPLKGFANGGMSSGGMPALLMGGEYVMNRDAVKNYGTDFMSRLNSGTLPRYAQGGSIGGSYTTSQTGPQSQSNSVDDLVTALNTLNENLTKTSNITQSEAGKAIGTVSQESGMSVVNNISISMTPAGEVNSQVQSNTTQGTTTSQNDQNSAQNNAKLAEILRAKVVEVLVEQKRPGGLLYRS